MDVKLLKKNTEQNVFEYKVLLMFAFSKISIEPGLIGNRKRASGKLFSDLESSFHLGFALGIAFL